MLLEQLEQDGYHAFSPNRRADKLKLRTSSFVGSSAF